MLSSNEINKLIENLLAQRVKLLWVISQIPVNEEQKNWIKIGKENLYKVNSLLSDFDVEFPN